MPADFHVSNGISGPFYFNVETKIPYQFTPVPSKLFYCLDKNCKAMLFALIDLNQLYANPDGWFFRSNKDLQDDTDLSQNLVKVVLDTLYRAGIINVFSVGKGTGHTSNRIHINFESFNKYEAYSFNDIRNNPDLHIRTISYKDHHTPAYCERLGDSESEALGESIGEKMTTIIDTPDTLNTSNTIDNILDTIEEPAAIETSIPKGGIDFPEVATPVVPKASLPSISAEVPSYSSSSSTGMKTEKQILLEEVLRTFLEYNQTSLDIQLLKEDCYQFLEKYNIRIGSLSQSILFKTNRRLSPTSIVLYLKDYVEEYGLPPAHEKTISA